MPTFTPPVYKTQDKLVLEIPFQVTLLTLTQNTVVVGPIPFPFRIIGTRSTGAVTANIDVQYYFLVSGNPNTSTTGVPPDDNIYGSVSPTAFWRSDTINELHILNYKVAERNRYLKVHFVNNDAITRFMQASITIEQLAEGE
jgi:hypothetical protein